MSDEIQPGSFEEFKKSFAYGSRNDLNFKFLAGLSDEDAATFFQELLWKLGDTLDDGSADRLIAHAVAWQVRAYAGEGSKTYDDGPFTPLRKPLAQSRIALMASSGHFVAGHDPQPFGVENMSQEEACERIMDFIRSEPRLSTIPAGTPREQLRARHGGYDVRAAQADPNTVLPHEIMLELAGEGRFGELASDVYSFVGACSQRRLLNKTGPQWVKLFQERGVDAAVLVPV